MLKNYTISKFLFLVTIIIFFIEFFFIKNCFSVEPEEFLKNTQQELRARDISKNIRCLVCQNQSIDDSSADLAKDLRILIRYKITEGLTDKEIYKYLTDRYGDFILLNPPLKTSTFLLWFFPLVLFIIGILVVYSYHRKSNSKLYNR